MFGVTSELYVNNSSVESLVFLAALTAILYSADNVAEWEDAAARAVPRQTLPDSAIALP